MARRIRSDERQADLFDAPPQPVRPPTSKASRQSKSAIEAPTAGAETAAAFAERAGPADLDELVLALADDALAHLALASARQLRRRMTRAAGGRQRASGTGKNRSALNRAGQHLAAEWAAPPEEAW